MLMRCLYCDRDKEDITGEHVIPRSIGGNLKETNPFKLKEVCSECNNACGRYVDGPFIRGPLTHQAKVTTSVRAFNPGITESLPLNFMGQVEDLNFGSRICELWLGPTGDRIYHFHDPYPLGQDSPAVVGRPTYLREDQADPGFVFLFVRSNNPVWWPVIFKSVVQQFPGGQLFLGSIPAKVEALAPFAEALRGFSPLRADLGELYQKLRALNGLQHQTTGRVSIDYGSRFLAKLALGLGGLFLDTSFRGSESADLLRKFLWTRKLEDRQRIPFRGRNFISDPDPNFARMAEFLSWPGGHLVMMLPRGRFFMMYAKFFDGESATGLISNEPEHWRKVNEEGVVFIISPGLRKCVEPITLTAFILHRTGQLIASSLSELEDEEKVNPLPPFDLPDDAK
jgi:HNH endonuclease